MGLARWLNTKIIICTYSEMFVAAMEYGNVTCERKDFDNLETTTKPLPLQIAFVLYFY